MVRPAASLSLDLDNYWSYLKTHGNPAWETYPSYLATVVPRALAFLRERGLRVTVFVVGRDALRPEHRGVLSSISSAGHEIGNHSHNHEPWLHRYPPDQVDQELRAAHEAIEEATGVRPRGFGGWRDVLRPISPYQWETGSGRLVEIPVTTVPFLRLPFHFSYLLYIAERSEWLGALYPRFPPPLRLVT